VGVLHDHGLEGGEDGGEADYGGRREEGLGGADFVEDGAEEGVVFVEAIFFELGAGFGKDKGGRGEWVISGLDVIQS